MRDVVSNAVTVRPVILGRDGERRADGADGADGAGSTAILDIDGSLNSEHPSAVAE